MVNDWVAANEKRKKRETISRRKEKADRRQKKSAGAVNENLDMDELLKKKEDRNW